MLHIRTCRQTLIHIKLFSYKNVLWVFNAHEILDPSIGINIKWSPDSQAPQSSWLSWQDLDLYSSLGGISSLLSPCERNHWTQVVGLLASAFIHWAIWSTQSWFSTALLCLYSSISLLSCLSLLDQVRPVMFCMSYMVQLDFSFSVALFFWYTVNLHSDW